MADKVEERLELVDIWLEDALTSVLEGRAFLVKAIRALEKLASEDYVEKFWSTRAKNVLRDLDAVAKHLDELEVVFRNSKLE
jgi:hypothetical protein